MTPAARQDTDKAPRTNINVTLQKPATTPLEALCAGEEPLAEQYPAHYYWLWLADVLGPASANAGRVLDAFGDAQSVYEARESDLFAAAVGKIIAARVRGQVLDADACAARVAQCDAFGVHILTFADAEYPLALSRIPDPPLVLYCTGNLAALHATAMVGMVGTRRPTAYGAAAAARFGGDFARSGAVIISGLADGLDAESHRAAVEAGCATIGIMGTPITKTYPATNAPLRQQMESLGGLTISEYPHGFCTGRTKSTFLQRNRIIAALSDALVVVEARSKSGTMSTVAHAERYETPIFAVPGSVFSTLSEGTNMLLCEGRAKMLMQSSDVLATLQLPQPATGAVGAVASSPAPKAVQIPLSPNAKKVLACVGATPTNVVSIAKQSGLSMGAVLGALSNLEMSERIASLPGKLYVIV